MSPISVVIIAYNEVTKIEAAFQSVAWADEIVVLDLGSTDGTLTVCEKYAHRIESHPWVPFADPLRNYAMSLASHEWVLLLDPDERVSKPLATQMQVIVDEDWPVDMVTVEHDNIRFGKVLLESEARTVSRTPRMVRRATVSWPERVHTVPSSHGIRSVHLSRADLGGGIVHDTWSTIDDVVGRFARYTEHDARSMLTDGRIYTTHDAIVSVWREFRDIYFYQKAYRDGVPGLYFAIGMAMYRTIVWMHVWELEGRKALHDPPVKRYGHVLGLVFHVVAIPALSARRLMRKFYSRFKPVA
jgi:glycosyltransferase involved in cell wall biosynthesis